MPTGPGAAPREPAPTAALVLPPGVIRAILSGAPTLWSGTITMQEPIGSGKYRLIVKEFESYYDDDSQTIDPTKGTATRLVYADTLDL